MNGQTITLDCDPVDKPPHYTHGEIECIEAIREVVRRVNDGEEGYLCR